MRTSSGDITKSREQIIEEATEAIRHATREVVDGKYNTQYIKEAAERLIDLRMTYTDRYGKADLQGNTYAYRQAVAEVMGSAGISESERAKVMNAIRYHIGNAVRARLTPEELEDYGFLKTAPLDRARKDRVQRAKMQRAAVLGEEQITDPAEVQAALRSAANLLDNISLTTLSPVEKKVCQVFLDHLAERLREVRTAAKA
jgi:hypothetical protein